MTFEEKVLARVNGICTVCAHDYRCHLNGTCWYPTPICGEWHWPGAPRPRAKRAYQQDVVEED